MIESAIGIYKIPALWDRTEKEVFNKKIENFNYQKKDILDNFNEHASRMTSIKDNVYLKIFIKITKKFNINECHYIFIDETLEVSLKFHFENTNIWILKNIDDLLYFRFGNLYFLRGNYLNFYNLLVPENAKIIFYPATSLVYSYTTNENKKLKRKRTVKKSLMNRNYVVKEHEFYKRINIALVHEDETYREIFKFSNLINFFKFSSDKFNYLNLSRIYDFIFVADATQYTKNHNLMLDFINYCEINKFKYKFVYVTIASILKEKMKNFIDPSKLEYVELEYLENLKPDELNILFNKAKINLIFSGRDACPRTISESLASGCYNIALDTLSDGKQYHSNLLGEIISNEEGIMIMGQSKSIGYVGDENIWKKIINISKLSFDHKQISILSKEKFNIDVLLNNINI